MASFHDAIPDPKLMDDRGSKLLCTAIIVATAMDYYDAIGKEECQQEYDDPDKVPYYELNNKYWIEWFLNSELYNAITNIPPSYFIKKITELKSSGKEFPKVSNYTAVRDDPSIRVMHGTGKHYNGRASSSMNGLGSLI